MMNQFFVRYIPGGMSLNHSAWWLYETKSNGQEVPIKPILVVRY